MPTPNVPDFTHSPPLTKQVRKEIADEIWRDVQTIASKVVITYDTHVIQVLIFPPSAEGQYTVTGRNPTTGVMRDGLYQE